VAETCCQSVWLCRLTELHATKLQKISSVLPAVSAQLTDSHMSGCDFVSFASTDSEPLYTVYYCDRAHSISRPSLDHVMSSSGDRPELVLLISQDSTGLDSTGFCVFGLCLRLSWTRLVLI